MNAYVKKRLHVVLALLLCLSLAILPCAAHAAGQVDGNLQIVFLDVGQADAALVFSGGQILVCVAGRGYYQEEGKDAVEMKPGDVVNIPAGVKHWHGAAPDSWFSHLAVEVPGVEGFNEWLEPVGDDVYGKLTIN